MSRRALIRMTDDEVAAFLQGRHTMSVATIGADGRPHLVAMWYGFLDGAPAFWTFTKSQKIVNLRRDPRITCMVETGATYEELRGVELSGTASLLDDDASKRELGRSVTERYTGIADDAVVAAIGAKRTVVRIDVDKVVSWDHRKLGGRY